MKEGDKNEVTQKMNKYVIYGIFILIYDNIT